jgi:hypothetical protein
MGPIVVETTIIKATTFNTTKSSTPPIVLLEIMQVPIGLLSETFHYTNFGSRTT